MDRLEEAKIELMEIRAYQELDGKPFSFYNEAVIYNNSKNSEHVYYELQERNLLEEINSLERSKILMGKNKKRNRYYEDRLATQRKIKKAEPFWYLSKIENKFGEVVGIKELDISKCRKFAKKQTNKRLRQRRDDLPMSHGDYRKAFDYWWTVF